MIFAFVFPYSRTLRQKKENIKIIFEMDFRSL